MCNVDELRTAIQSDVDQARLMNLFYAHSTYPCDDETIDSFKPLMSPDTHERFARISPKNCPKLQKLQMIVESPTIHAAIDVPGADLMQIYETCLDMADA